MYSHVLDLWRCQLFLIVFDPIRDAHEDAESVQAVHVPRVGLGHGHEDLFGLCLAQDAGERLQKHLEVININILNQSYNRNAFFLYVGHVNCVIVSL